MRGPEILARSLSIPIPMGKDRKPWQYHSRSDRHSKIACWCILLDLFEQSTLLEKLEELPRRRTTAETGFDAIGVVVVDCKNDGSSPVRLISDDPAPKPGDLFHYEQMIRRIVHYYESRFPLR